MFKSVEHIGLDQCQTQCYIISSLCLVVYLSMCVYVSMSMGIDPWVNRGTLSPYFLKWREHPVSCPHYFFQGRHSLY